MHKKISLIVMVIVLFIAWSGNTVSNTAICTAGNEQKRPQAASDGEGGAVIVWEDSRSGSDYDIYAQRLDVNGRRLWRSGGVAVCSVLGSQHYPRIVADGSGGVIITWHDRRGGKNYDIFAQRLDANGRAAWTTNGIPVCSADGDQFDPFPLSDGSGGVIIAWQDRRSGNDYDIYAQRIDPSGKFRWETDGIAVCSEKGDQDNHQIVPDGQGGVVIAWQDRRNNKDYDIYAQRVSPNGTLQWPGSGTAVCSAQHDQRGPRMIAAGNGAVVLTWQDKRNGKDFDIYSQRLDETGKIQWTGNGIAICNEANSQYDPLLVPDGKGGAIITWQDYRKGSDCNFEAFDEMSDMKADLCSEQQLNDWNIYSQSVDSSGRTRWAANGVQICLGTVDQFKPFAIADGSGGAIITWRAADKENDHNIYAQKVSASGKINWNPNGVAVTTAPGNQMDPLLVADGSGGAIITWYDKRQGSHYDIYAQNICFTGKIGNCPKPMAKRF